MTTAVVAVIGGIAIVFIGRLLVSLFVKPIFKLKEEIGKIGSSLIYYANIYGNPGFNPILEKEASDVLRNHASNLRADAFSIPLYGFWSMLRLAINKGSVVKASQELIGLSNSMGAGNKARVNVSTADTIRTLLKIPQG